MLAVFHYLHWGGALCFYTIIENVLPKMKILGKMDLLQFEIGDHC